MGWQNLPPQPLEAAALPLRRSGAPWGALLVGSWCPQHRQTCKELPAGAGLLGVESAVTAGGLQRFAPRRNTASAESSVASKSDLELDRDLELAAGIGTWLVK